MGDTNRTQVIISEETTWAETPSTPVMGYLRFNSADFAGVIELIQSEEIREDRQVVDHIKVSESAKGSLMSEYSYGSFDDLLEGALCKDAVVATITAGTISAASADNSINDSGSGFVSAGFVANQWIRIAGFTGTAGNNGVAKIVSVAAGKIVIADAAAGGITLVNDASGESVTVSGKLWRNGTTDKSYLIEQGFPDMSDTTYLSYRGMRVASMKLEVVAKQQVKISFTFEGEGEYASGSSLDASPAARTTTAVINAALNVGSIKEGGTAMTVAVRSVTVDVNNNPRTNDEIGAYKPDDIGFGTFNVSGQVDAFFRTRALKAKFLAKTETSFECRLTDDAGKVTIITIPSMFYSGSTSPISGQNADVMNANSFVARRHSTTDCTIQIDAVG